MWKVYHKFSTLICCLTVHQIIDRTWIHIDAAPTCSSKVPSIVSWGKSCWNSWKRCDLCRYACRRRSTRRCSHRHRLHRDSRRLPASKRRPTTARVFARVHSSRGRRRVDSCKNRREFVEMSCVELSDNRGEFVCRKKKNAKNDENFSVFYCLLLRSISEASYWYWRTFSKKTAQIHHNCSNYHLINENYSEARCQREVSICWLENYIHYISNLSSLSSSCV